MNDLQRDRGLIDEIATRMASVAGSGRYILGPEVDAFEREFAAYCGVSFAVCVANGTDALELAIKALGVAPGARVGTVANAGMYATTAILAAGARPEYLEVDPGSMLLSLLALEAHAPDRLAALVVTHLYGRMADMRPILAWADRNGVSVIEDCAQAHGALYKGKRAGAWGRLAAFSFYPTKNLGAFGDAGAVTTSDERLASRVRRLRQYGWEDKYVSTLEGGRNSRLDELQAAVLRVKLARLDGWNVRRRQIAGRYGVEIHHPDVRTPPPPDETSACHLYVVRSSDRDRLRRHLTEQGIGTDVHYPVPDYAQPGLKGGIPGPSLPETDQACAEVLSLPCFPEMQDDEVGQVIQAVNSWTA